MIIYVAGPMTGYPNKNIPSFNQAQVVLQDLGYKVLSPVSVEGDGNQTWQWYMRAALRLLLEADAVALLPNWEDSKGATLEREIAIALGMEVRALQNWL